MANTHAYSSQTYNTPFAAPGVKNKAAFVVAVYVVAVYVVVVVDVLV